MGKSLKDKLAIMHRMYGKNTEGKICRDCSHFVKCQANRVHNKCEVYGISNSEATDFGTIQVGCGLWGVDIPDRNIYKGLELNRKRNYEPQEETLF